MTAKRTKQAVLEQEFLSLRAKILELAAGLDRLDRAAGQRPDDGRPDQLDRAMRLLLDAGPARAERIQLVFSRDYDETWRLQFSV
ncbi:MAG: hypothetical protein DCC67_12885 [Planctomycetota bacterium]|nr:MAG: hypothetical protein DCC67_12885 [Planctomycetota bacterium]